MKSHARQTVFKRGFLFTLALAATVLLATTNSMAAAEEGVTVAVTADLFITNAKVVSDVIFAHPSVSAVLLAGDTDNATPTPLESYQKLYQGTYDRFLAKIHPCPGNHDRHSKPPFSAYCTFWGQAAHAPEMYYSFDLGGWHIVSLDSVTFARDEAKASEQLRWLKADLAAKPKAPTLVYWHYPLFSNANHCGAPKMKPLWDAIYAPVSYTHLDVYKRQLLERTRKALPRTRLIICEPFVLRCGAVNEKWFPQFDAYRASARNVAAAFDATFVPFQSMFDDLIAYAPPQHWAQDGVHPSPHGAAAMAHCWLTHAPA